MKTNSKSRRKFDALAAKMYPEGMNEWHPDDDEPAPTISELCCDTCDDLETQDTPLGNCSSALIVALQKELKRSRQLVTTLVRDLQMAVQTFEDCCRCYECKSCENSEKMAKHIILAKEQISRIKMCEI